MSGRAANRSPAAAHLFLAIALAGSAGAGVSACHRTAAPPPQPLPPVASIPQVPSEPETAGKSTKFEATAYSIEGTTRDGSRARRGIVAADPRVLPIGTRIRVRGAGGYDGNYVVADTGRTIKGREIDIYIPNDRQARKFGRKMVRVEILNRRAADAP